MNQLRKPIIIMLIASMVINSSCVSFKVLPGPYGESIPEKLKKGDIIMLTMSDGTQIRKTRVMEVWPDSVLLESDPRAIKISHIATMQKRQPDLVATAVLILVPVCLFIFILSQPVTTTTYNLKI